LKTEIIGLTGQRSSKERATGRRKGADPAQVYSRIVERYAMLFDRPEIRLRFLNNTLAKQVERQKQLQQSLRHFRFIERTRLYDWALEARFYSSIFEELRALTPRVPSTRRRQLQNVHVPFSARAFFVVYQTRHAFYAMGVLVVGLMLFGMYSLATWTARYANSYLSQRYQRGRTPIIVKAEGQGAGTALAATGTMFLPDYKPQKVWEVERNSDFERYSNGCRILTKYETENHPRGYYLIPRNSESDGDELRRDPIGIVYHTSESDIVPFIPQNNDSIQKRTNGVLDWIINKKSYNYLIDRFGETYRIVRDDHAAHHAGNSIWADQKYTYIGLNESFIGICFESTVAEGTTEETLTEAQIISGRALTNVLRSKYNIDDANCTTHGIVSINPDKMLIAFHHDWARGFPFEAMGLSDKYKILPPNMSDYGFTYDEEILEKLGRVLWPGAIAAEEEFKRRAESARINPELLRRKWRDRYIAQYEKARKLRAPLEETGKSSLAVQSSINSSSAGSGNN
jgi:hypothetical protein